ncbi:hypothetical protein CY34DRAFT_801107 [Suillus luteus UH-Slu-Lm8-n1]|uniref:Unplaced genomic scaffold CY34scaffold_36, whole genome shotgun sequence n=1 Tax=Suillus luteus UH-Slu-Lm8-n1 TaxID=930992 RepID=A0A0D0B7I0_9AGAM|nr:hypothetical protein CY34DRAFT_801107 [Suillus luteus UH-Slu-Lm8-n1]
MRFPFLCISLTLTLSVSVSACAHRFSSCRTSYDCCSDLLCMKYMNPTSGHCDYPTSR